MRPVAGAAARARELHGRGLDLLARGRPEAAARLLRRGLRLLGWTVDGPAPAEPVVVAAILNTLAMTEVFFDRAEAGFTLLDEAEKLVAAEDRGVIVQQRGAMLVMTGRMAEAQVHLDEAIELLSRSDQQLVLARSLNTRAVLHHNAGRIRLARADLSRCERIAYELDQHRLVAKATHNHALCDLLQGDITGALRNLDVAARAYRTADAPALLGTIAVDRARALLAAGLATEAGTELDAALELLSPRSGGRDRAEAELTRAQAALAVGDWAVARTWAARAERRFGRQDNHTWGAVATLVRLGADFRQGRALATTASRAWELATELRVLGLVNDADAASLLAARAYCALGQSGSARVGIRECRPLTQVENRVQRRLALAEVAAADGDRRGVLRHCRLGLRLLGQHRDRFGSLDLRTGAAALGVELARLGLGAALERGAPAGVFSWLERSRAQSFRARPVRPPADEEVSDAVAELRHLSRSIRDAELAGHRDPAARRRCAELERTIRSRGWLTGGTGNGRGTAALAEVRTELVAAGAALVSFAVHDGRLLALVVTDRGATLCRLDHWERTSEAITLLHRDLDALCDRVLPPVLDAVVRDSARRRADELAAHLIAPLRPLIGDRDLVLVPTKALSAVPWSVLPELRGRPVTVAPSASAWLDARRLPTAGPVGPPVLVAGPYLAHAAAEVRAVAAVHPASVVLDGERATVAEVLRQMDGGTLVHIAAHGHHEQDNVLFSRLDLADGPLMAHDVQQLRAAPAHVVLPSCDIGRTVVRRGDELLGFTAALLYVGTRTVISCVNRVLDERAVGTMAAYHRALLAGHPPARALADASADDPFSPFICSGAG